LPIFVFIRIIDDKARSMNCATISADIISSSALPAGAKKLLFTAIPELLEKLGNQYGNEKFIGRVVQGDYIECALQRPIHALRIALLLKTFIKSIELPDLDRSDKRIRYFREHAIRLAVAVAPLTTLDPGNGIIDGEAIYLSGRTVKGMSTSGKQKIVVKGTMFFRSPDPEQEEKFDTLFALLDKILAGCSRRQCEILFHKLSGLNEKQISELLKRNQSTVSGHSTAAGWQAIEKAVNYFEKFIS
jgi:hypothetical protein